MITLTIEHILGTGRPAAQELAKALRAADHVDVVRIDTTGAGAIFADRLEQMMKGAGTHAVLQRYNPAAPEMPRMDLRHVPSDPACSEYRNGYAVSALSRCPICSPAGELSLQPLPDFPRPGRERVEFPTPANLPSFTCPVCGRTSYNPNDVENGYCGNCHDWTADDKPVA